MLLDSVVDDDSSSPSVDQGITPSPDSIDDGNGDENAPRMGQDITPPINSIDSGGAHDSVESVPNVDQVITQSPDAIDDGGDGNAPMVNQRIPTSTTQDLKMSAVIRKVTVPGIDMKNIETLTKSLLTTSVNLTTLNLDPSTKTIVNQFIQELVDTTTAIRSLTAPYTNAVAATTFALFPRMPLDLRYTIWKLTLPRSRILKVKLSQVVRDGRKIDIIGFDNIIPAVFHVDKESRDFAIGYYYVQLSSDDALKVHTRINPRTDTLFFPRSFYKSMSYHRDLLLLLRVSHWSAAALAQVRKIVVDSRLWDVLDGTLEQKTFAHFTALEELGFAYHEPECREEVHEDQWKTPQPLVDFIDLEPSASVPECRTWFRQVAGDLFHHRNSVDELRFLNPPDISLKAISEGGLRCV